MGAMKYFRASNRPTGQAGMPNSWIMILFQTPAVSMSLIAEPIWKVLKRSMRQMLKGMIESFVSTFPVVVEISTCVPVAAIYLNQ
jgi:hypothetical protein